AQELEALEVNRCGRGAILDRLGSPRLGGVALHQIEDRAELGAAVGDRLDDLGVDARLLSVAPGVDGENAQEKDQERDVTVGGPVVEIEERAPDATARGAAELPGILGRLAGSRRRAAGAGTRADDRRGGVYRRRLAVSRDRVPGRRGWQLRPEELRP